MAAQGELNWVNVLRAWSMAGVYLWHCEEYCGGGRTLSLFISPVCMAVFFFVSGYLFFRKAYGLGQSQTWRHQFGNVFFRLVVPTMLFAALLYVPKTLFHRQVASWAGFGFSVVGGTTFWFTSALALIQISAIGLLWLMRLVNLSRRLTMAMMMVVGTCLWLGFTQIHAPFNAFPWSFTSGMHYFIFFVLGGCFSASSLLNDYSRPRHPFLFVLPFAVYVVLSLFVGHPHAMLDHLLRLVAAMVGLACFVPLACLVPPSRWQTFVGRNSIAFYFLCGLMPALWAFLFRHFGFEGGWAVPAVFLLSFMLSGCTSWLLRRYTPSLFDLRELKPTSCV